jgi:hypothetical protein
MANLEDIPGLFASRYGRRNVNNGRNTLEGVGEIAFYKVLDDDDVDLVAVLGVQLPQRIGLSGSRNPDEASSAAVNRNMVYLLTPGCGTPLSRGVPKRVSQYIRTRR